MTNIVVDRPEPGIRVVTLNRPAKLNACDREAWLGLASAFSAFLGDRSVRAVVICGAGGNFCAGDDILAYAAVRNDEAESAAYRLAISQAHAAIESAPFPVVAAIDGVCVGGGCSIALCCDFRLAGAKVRAGIPAAKLGLAYSLEHCQRLAALIGIANARQMLFSGELFGAERGHSIGLFDRIVGDDVMHSAMELARSLCGNAPLSIAATKASLSAIMLGQTTERRQAVAEAFRRAEASRDAAEGARAFAEKRPPRFTGE